MNESEKPLPLNVAEPGEMPKPEVPGELPVNDLAKLEALAAGTVGDIAEALDSLSPLELEQLSVLETAGKARTTALGAIAREQEARAELEAGGAEESAAAIPNIMGDANSYAQMRAKEIDQSKLEHKVLTLDGWLHPIPKARAE